MEGAVYGTITFLSFLVAATLFISSFLRAPKQLFPGIHGFRILGTNMHCFIRNEFVRLSKATGQKLKLLPDRAEIFKKRSRNSMHMSLAADVMGFKVM